jgi:hypothetical protein
LKGFQKVYLEPGESQRITLTLDQKATSYYDVDTHNWKIAEGQYQIMIGASSRDIRLTGSVWQEWTPPTIDLVVPAEAVTQAAGEPGNYPLNSIQNASYTCDDMQSGVASCVGTTANDAPFDTSTVGFHSFTVEAKDIANNSSSVTHQYNVYWPNWRGFFPPIEMGSVYNLANAGSAIPVKFSLGGNYGLGIIAEGYPRTEVVACDTELPLDIVEVTTTAGGSTLSYDEKADQYIYVMKSNKSWKGSCRKLVVKLVDNTEHTAWFRFK